MFDSRKEIAVAEDLSIKGAENIPLQNDSNKRFVRLRVDNLETNQIAQPQLLTC